MNELLLVSVSETGQRTSHCPLSSEPQLPPHPQHDAVAVVCTMAQELRALTDVNEYAPVVGASLTWLQPSQPQHSMCPSLAATPHVCPARPPSLISAIATSGGVPTLPLRPHPLHEGMGIIKV